MVQILEIKELAKHFGTKAGLAGINYAVGPGKLIGLLGPNGSGKTTLLRTISGLVKPSQGIVTVNSTPVGQKTKEWVSFLSAENMLYDWMKVGDAIEFYTNFFDNFRTEQALAWVAEYHLESKMVVKELSKGTIKILNLILALSRDCPLYLLDEPFNGIDLVMREYIFKMIIEACSPDKTMVISTHMVAESESIFDEVVILDKGRIVLQGEAETLRAQEGKSITQVYKDYFRDSTKAQTKDGCMYGRTV